MTEKRDMFDIGNTAPDCLYDFALLLTAAEEAGVDRGSELWKAFRRLFDSAWGQLPEIVTHDFRPTD